MILIISSWLNSFLFQLQFRMHSRFVLRFLYFQFFQIFSFLVLFKSSVLLSGTVQFVLSIAIDSSDLILFAEELFSLLCSIGAGAVTSSNYKSHIASSSNINSSHEKRDSSSFWTSTIIGCCCLDDAAKHAPMDMNVFDSNVMLAIIILILMHFVSGIICLERSSLLLSHYF